MRDAVHRRALDCDVVGQAVYPHRLVVGGRNADSVEAGDMCRRGLLGGGLALRGHGEFLLPGNDGESTTRGRSGARTRLSFAFVAPGTRLWPQWILQASFNRRPELGRAAAPRSLSRCAHSFAAAMRAS